MSDDARPLTPEQRAVFVDGGIYKADPNDFADHTWISRYWPTSGQYHCRNWNFLCRFQDDGNVCMYDSYYGTSYPDTSFVIDGKDFDRIARRFHLVMADKDDWEPCTCPSEYDKRDIIFHLPMGSGGHEYSSTTWVRKDAVKPIAYEINACFRRLRDEVRKTTNTCSMAWEQRRLMRLIEDAETAGTPIDDSADMARCQSLIEGYPIQAIDTLSIRTNAGRFEPNEAMFASLDMNPRFSGHLLPELYTSDDTDGECEIIVPVVDEEGICLLFVASDATLDDIWTCDATLANVEYLLDPKNGPDVRKHVFDEFDPSHGNRNLQAYLGRVSKAIEVIDQAAHLFDGLG